MSRDRRVLFSMRAGAVVGLGSTLPLWSDAGERWGFLLLLSLPGIIVALPLGCMGVIGNAHDPNAVVIALVDACFYAWLSYRLMKWKGRLAG
ncbi:MAG TPA: hypothetical protein VM865_00545 [Acidobacteriaceae bacterium]|jgi:hypothetical protein|nr:hypothetical protein [Acidobacteriaceae bacterium]